MQPIQTALCSFGMSGWVFHAPFIQHNPGFNLYGVVERTKNLTVEKFPAIKTFRSLEEMLADKHIELVIVNTPNLTHYEFAKMALLAGKHVVVEKPFTPTVDQCKELIAIAKDNNLHLSVYQNRRFDSDFRTVKKIINEGVLGEIIDASIHYDRFVPALSYKAHKETAAKGVGCLYDLGSHIIDQALQLFGMPEAVFADIMVNRPGSAVDDYIDIKLFYPHTRVTIKSSYFVREPLPGFVFHGRKGSFLKHRADVQEAALQAGTSVDAENWGIEPIEKQGFLHTEHDGEIIKTSISTEKGNYGDYYEGIYHAIRNGAPLPVTAEEGLNIIKVIEAALESHQQQRVVSLNK
jgi:predicted dehydrogenase